LGNFVSVKLRTINQFLFLFSKVSKVFFLYIWRYIIVCICLNDCEGIGIFLFCIITSFFIFFICVCVCKYRSFDEHWNGLYTLTCIHCHYLSSSTDVQGLFYNFQQPVTGCWFDRIWYKIILTIITDANSIYYSP